LKNVFQSSLEEGGGFAWLVEVVLAAEDGAAGEAEVELCRHREGVKKEDGVEVGVLN